MAADNVSPRPVLAVRPGLTEVAELLAAGAEPGRWSPYAAVWSGDPGELPAVREGRAGVQDEGSQLVALGLAPVLIASGIILLAATGVGLVAAAPAGLAGAAVVTYCWGPGCNGAARGALALARAGRQAREMIGGFEYWVREGLPVRTESGQRRGAVDPLTAPAGCGC